MSRDSLSAGNFEFGSDDQSSFRANFRNDEQAAEGISILRPASSAGCGSSTATRSWSRSSAATIPAPAARAAGFKACCLTADSCHRARPLRALNA